MRLLVMTILVATFLHPFSALAEIKTVTHTVQQPFGGSQSPDDARTAGIARAKREALEQFGTYIESITIVKNAQVDSDEILALTAGVTKTEVVKQRNYTDSDAFGLEITVKIELDTAVLDKSLKRLLDDRNHLKDLKAASIREKKLLVKIAELQKENLKHGKSNQESLKLKNDFQTSSNGLTAVELYNKADSILKGTQSKQIKKTITDNDRFSSYKKAIEYLDKSISFDPEFVEAYTLRGMLFVFLKQLDRALADFDKGIHLDPNNANLYVNRANIYSSLKNIDAAISEYNHAISIDPNQMLPYNNRGLEYLESKEYEKALSDLNQAIRLDPKPSFPYFNRGNIYYNLEQYERAIIDYDQAISINPENEFALRNRSEAHLILGQYDSAIADYTNLIRINPKSGDSYNNRGVSFSELNKIKEACADFKKACKLGVCEGYKNSQKNKVCK